MGNIYILCPALVQTGGPEALHQLCYYLNNLNQQAYMIYYGQYSTSPVAPLYLKYNTKYVDVIEDSIEHTLVVPEVMIPILRQFKNIKKVIWWLSVDNYLVGENFKKCHSGLNYYNYTTPDIIHAAQSYYAIDFLEKSGVNSKNIFKLFDPVNDTYRQNAKDLFKYSRNNVVLFNPKKGIDFTKALINASKEITWIPLNQPTQQEVAELMLKSKVYVDFGHHPGRDRLPREAAMSGCCIITSKRGSAKFYQDVLIADEYKFEDQQANINPILDKIQEIFSNYESEKQKFSDYRMMLMNEEKTFKQHIIKLFNLKDH